MTEIHAAGWATYHFNGQLDIIFTHAGVVVLRLGVGLQNGRSSTAGCRLD